MTRTKTETIADVWADDFGGVAVEVRGTQAQLEIAEAEQLRDELDEAISAALACRIEKAAPAAETRTP
ncbi:hypothetical protein [Curtobacterium sp. MCBD17_008]|uniref:hypothetical protein n=1 Tax=Curtobacterium sp. MCBD17_008 TaxID=2175656 RepID=UPI000DA92FD9|nr:hypothetical protein [Curtobacterium sp. MCBD17_008]PZE89957.1 hypothetical protein DEI95_13120 [Curtobacterium sp. MCBD17_008]